MTGFLDGAASFIAAILTIVLCGGPVWLSHLAIAGGFAPLWAYVPVAGLAFVCVLMTFSFLDKGFKGISPSRDRRR